MKKSLILATAMIAGVVAAPAAAATTADCASYERVETRQVGGGVTSLPFSYFIAPRPGKIELCLDGSAGTDYDLVLLKFVPGGPETVATAEGGGSDKTLSYESTAVAAYRVLVITDVEGKYTLGVTTP